MADPFIPPPEPGASSNDISAGYYTRNALQNAGWTPEAVNWAGQVPLKYSDPNARPYMRGEAYLPDNTAGMYTNFNTMLPGMQTDPGLVTIRSANMTPDRHLSQWIEHEMMHAWESPQNPGGSMSLPPAVRQKDFYRVMDELMVNHPEVMANAFWTNYGPMNTWRSQHENNPMRGVVAAPQMDSQHFNQTLFNQGYNPEQISDWYREKYLSEYR